MTSLENMVISVTPEEDTKSVINLETNQITDIKERPSVNFGGGIELLMNEKKKGASTEIGLGELSDLENELNTLSSDVNNIKSIENSKSSIFNNTINSLKTESLLGGRDDKINIDNISKEGPSVGEATSQSFSENKTSWDGYGKFKNIPDVSNEAAFTKEEILREKFKFLRRLEELERKGATLTKKYSMESPLSELQGEYEMIISEKEKSNSVKFQGRMLMAAITGLEFLNSKFDPFDLKMDGWAEQINENVGDYDEIFGELHEKYKSKAKMAPELKLLFQLGGSAIMVHMTNTMFKASLPGMDEIMKQNPELMQQFTQAAVGSMGDNNPGFGNFMNNFIPSSSAPDSSPPPPNMGSPPPAINTQAARSERYRSPISRPDLMAAQTQQGISIEEKYSDIKRTEAKPKRPEMQGPENIGNILSGLKTKQVNIPTSESKKDGSTISVQDLKELTSQKIPKSNRKARSSSSKNIVSLDL